ncbi:MAG TPA: fumarylacetoacetate hydrolase family protein [Thermomicrobiales bacterium]|nr:fumarylacetoacetate hydrolase family protein [Thermomicrobiales bacterium]
MPLVRYQIAGSETPRLGVLDGEQVFELTTPSTVHAALQLPLADLQAAVQDVLDNTRDPLDIRQISLLAPIDTQEVWASGVTYSRSRDARMEESTQKDVYDLVYEAARPELFFKATPSRVSGPDGTIAIRGDSTWDVPEPELALVINSHKEVIGYTIGNDVSSRSIEGENPLYLPQAKVYSACAAVGPAIVLVNEIDNPNDLEITLVIERNGEVNFEGKTSTSQIHRPLAELVEYLHRYNAFLSGAILMTGTGIIPPAEFTLEDGDVVNITIDKIGTLRNPVVRLKA